MIDAAHRMLSALAVGIEKAVQALTPVDSAAEKRQWRAAVHKLGTGVHDGQQTPPTPEVLLRRMRAYLQMQMLPIMWDTDKEGMRTDVHRTIGAITGRLSANETSPPSAQEQIIATDTMARHLKTYGKGAVLLSGYCPFQARPQRSTN